MGSEAGPGPVATTAPQQGFTPASHASGPKQLPKAGSNSWEKVFECVSLLGALHTQPVPVPRPAMLPDLGSIRVRWLRTKAAEGREASLGLPGVACLIPKSL